MERYLSNEVYSDLGKKMVLLTGPRQVGKTTLAKQLMLRFRRPVSIVRGADWLAELAA